MFCKHCGQRLHVNEENCTNCGSAVTKGPHPQETKYKNKYIQRMRNDRWFLVYVIVSVLTFICFVYTFFSIGIQLQSSYTYDSRSNNDEFLIVTLFGFIGFFIASFFLALKTYMMKWWIVFMLFYVNILFLVVLN